MSPFFISSLFVGRSLYPPFSLSAVLFIRRSLYQSFVGTFVGAIADESGEFFVIRLFLQLCIYALLFSEKSQFSEVLTVTVPAFC